MRPDDIKGRLVGKHVKVHNMDFEVSEKDRMLRIIPHAEEENEIKTLPITHVELTGKGDKTQVVISAKMRKIDSGGPMLILIFCLFLLIGSGATFYFGKNEYLTYTYTLGTIGVLILLVFWLRMERGYFDYVRKIRDYIKNQSVA
ncbi:MAG: hypothetical protein BGO70_17305 [Bacteroidetes bacterium 43-93]|jgi:hypothetical protein|nr:MAG: hypothetical protein BGO70_17305 [Bacteroidetes bacterium 43-93]